VSVCRIVAELRPADHAKAIGWPLLQLEDHSAQRRSVVCPKNLCTAWSDHLMVDARLLALGLCLTAATTGVQLIGGRLPPYSTSLQLRGGPRCAEQAADDQRAQHQLRECLVQTARSGRTPPCASPWCAGGN